MNQRTLNRFRTANAVYFNETGKGLMAELTEKLADALKKTFLGDNLKRRMDSIMVDNGIRHLSRLQLAHVVTKGALFLLRDHEVSVPDVPQHYMEDFDENAVTYHTSAPASEKLETAFRDACVVRNLIPEGLRESDEARILERVISEQVILTEDGSFDTVRDGKTLTSTTLNNPAEPESTIRKKAENTHHGFVGNFAESVDMDTNRKIIDSVDFQPNTYSDSQFARDEIARMAEAGDTSVLVTDGVYASVDNINEGAAHGIELTGTAMTGKETADLAADFQVDKEDQTVVCPFGKKADRAVYSEKSESYRVYFIKDKTCAGCPFHESGECPLKEHKNVRSWNVSRKMIQRASIQRKTRTQEFASEYRFRNGVEAIPSQLRRMQNIDRMPFRGFVRKKQGYLMAISGINIRRSLNYALEEALNAFGFLLHGSDLEAIREVRRHFTSSRTGSLKYVHRRWTA